MGQEFARDCLEGLPGLFDLFIGFRDAYGRGTGFNDFHEFSVQVLQKSHLLPSNEHFPPRQRGHDGWGSEAKLGKKASHLIQRLWDGAIIPKFINSYELEGLYYHNDFRDNTSMVQIRY